MAEQAQEHVFPGGIYKGQLKDGIRHGNGSMTYTTEIENLKPGDVYIGEW